MPPQMPPCNQCAITQRPSTHGWATYSRPSSYWEQALGGSFVLEYVQHYADSIDGVILHAPVGTRLDTRRFPWLMQLPGMRDLGQRMIAAPLMRPLFKRLLFMDHEAIPADYLNRFFDEYRQCQVFGQMFDIITADWYNALQQSDCPAVLLWGKEERVLSADHVQDYQALFPNNTVRLVPGWDHFPMIEQPAAYAEEISRLAQALVTQSTV